MITANRHDACVSDSAFIKNNNFGRASSDVDKADAEFALVRIESSVRGSERLKHDIVDVNSRLIGGSNQILRCSSSPGYHMRVHFEPHPNHADRILNAALFIDNELLRQQMDRLPIWGKRDGSR